MFANILIVTAYTNKWTWFNQQFIQMQIFPNLQFYCIQQKTQQFIHCSHTVHLAYYQTWKRFYSVIFAIYLICHILKTILLDKRMHMHSKIVLKWNESFIYIFDFIIIMYTLKIWEDKVEDGIDHILWGKYYSSIAIWVTQRLHVYFSMCEVSNTRIKSDNTRMKNYVPVS